jgi:hypothetical protein
MSMAFWLFFRDNETSSSDNEDLYSLCRYCDELDQLAKTLNVKDISSFVDTTDAELNEGWLDAEASVSSMKWFPSNDGLVTLQALKTALENPITLPKIKASARTELLEEVANCLSQLEQAHDKTFHFQLVM